VVTSAESGRFKGRAALALSLDSFELNGATYPVNTTTLAASVRVTASITGYGSGAETGAGAAIGAIASGGTGAFDRRGRGRCRRHGGCGLYR